MKRPRREERGFALLIVVLLVALLALTGAALLDVVQVDLSLSAEHSKIVRAQMVSDGALREVLADVNSGEQLPDFTACAGSGGGPGWGPACPNYRYNWASEIANQHIKNPDSINSTIVARVPLDETNSAYAKWTASPDTEENYTATVDLLRTDVPVEDTSILNASAVVFEVNTAGKVGGNRNRAETSAQIFKIAPKNPNSLGTRLHGR